MTPEEKASKYLEDNQISYNCIDISVAIKAVRIALEAQNN
jgi:hypothetical protein